MGNRAGRDSTTGGEPNWQETIEGGQQFATGITTTFTDPEAVLEVRAADYSGTNWANTVNDPVIYNVYVSTRTYDNSTGQCVQGKLRNLRRRLEESDGVAFPTGNAVKVTKKQAEEACADLGAQKQNCITDIRMVNDQSVTDLIKQDFV